MAWKWHTDRAVLFLCRSFCSEVALLGRGGSCWHRLCTWQSSHYDLRAPSPYKYMEE